MAAERLLHPRDKVGRHQLTGKDNFILIWITAGKVSSNPVGVTITEHC